MRGLGVERAVHHTENRFFTILADAVTLYELSAQAERDYIQTTLAKSCVLSVNYALEAAANSFLESLDLSDSLKSKIDKLPTIEKFDFVLQWHTDSKLPRGDKEVQAIKELVDLRNSMVHSKVSQDKGYVETQAGNGAFAYEHKAIETSPPRKAQTSKISLDPEQYSSEDALIALKVLVAFLNRYVTQWWGISLDISAILLLPSWDGSISASPIKYEKNSLETILRHDGTLGIRFIKLHGIIP
jgi:hypothetical protein